MSDSTFSTTDISRPFTIEVPDAAILRACLDAEFAK